DEFSPVDAIRTFSSFLALDSSRLTVFVPPTGYCIIVCGAVLVEAIVNNKHTDVQLDPEEQEGVIPQSFVTQPPGLKLAHPNRTQRDGGLIANERRQVTLVISPEKLALTLALVVLCLLLGHVITQSVKIYYGFNTLGGLIPEFDLNSENNIPTWYSSSTLLLASALLTMIALVKLQWEEATRATGWCWQPFFCSSL